MGIFAVNVQVETCNFHKHPTYFFLVNFQTKMWEQGGYDNAGGFMDSTQSQTPGGGKDKKRSNNLVPVTIRNIKDADDEGLKVEGLDVGQLTVVGKSLRLNIKKPIPHLQLKMTPERLRSFIGRMMIHMQRI